VILWMAIAPMGVGHADPADVPADAWAVLDQGAKLAPAELPDLERRLRTKPGDLRTRLLLVGYHGLVQGRVGGEAGPHGEPYDSLILGLIEHHPRSILAGDVGMLFSRRTFDRGATLWLQLVKAYPNDAPILGNAGAFLTADILKADYWERGRTLLVEARRREPRTPRWPWKLGFVARRDFIDAGNSADGRRQAAVEALAYWEEATALADPVRDRWFPPRDAAACQGFADAAWRAGDLPKAKRYATEMLATAHAGDGNAIHDGHQILGLVALREGRIEDASGHLLASGRTPGSPQLGSFGPDMTLASELLAKGRREVVIEYLDLCEKFWKMSEGRIAEWKTAIRSGRVPDFGRHRRR